MSNKQLTADVVIDGRGAAAAGSGMPAHVAEADAARLLPGKSGANVAENCEVVVVTEPVPHRIVPVVSITTSDPAEVGYFHQ